MNWTRRVGLLCLCCLPIGWAAVGSAQDAVVGSGGDVVFLDDFSGSVSLSNDGGTYLLFHKMVGEGVGFDTGFSRLGLRAKLWDDHDSHLFGEIHMLITDSSRVGFNAGGGYRQIFGPSIFGVHAWYDNYESFHSNRYEQITFGAEYLHPLLDIRTNAYVPIGDRENFVGIADPGMDPLFMQNQLGTMGLAQFERAFAGWDLEAGVPFPVINWLRMYAGTYYLNFSGDDLWGARGRAEARVTEGVSLNLMVSDDRKFGTNVNLGVEVRFSGAMPTRFGQDFSALARRYDQVRRNWPVHISQELDEAFVPLVNPETSRPYNIAWVDNTAGPGGDGTVENPFEMLPGQAPNADLVLVRRGVGNTLGNIQLVPNQRLLGEGVQHFVDTTRLGVIPLPQDQFNNSGPFPTLQSTTPDPVVTLSHNNMVRAFNFMTDNAISGGSSNINDFHIQDITGTAGTGININDASGVGTIQNVNFNLQPMGTGVRVRNATGDPLELGIWNVVTRGGSNGVVVDAAGNDIQLHLDSVNVRQHATAGLTLRATNADLSATANNVRSEQNTGTGVVINLDGATGFAAFDNLQANDNTVHGLSLTAINGTTFDLDIIDSALNGNGGDNLLVNVQSGSDVNVFVDPTTLDDAGNDAFRFSVTGNSTLSATFWDVTMNNAGRDAVRGTVLGNSTVLFDFFNVQAEGADEVGLNLTVGGGSQAIGIFEDVSFSDSGENNIHVRAENSSLVSFDFENVLADNATADGGAVFIARTGSAIINNWNGGSVSNTLSNGIVADARNADSLVLINLEDVPVTGNAGNGLLFDASNGGTVIVTATGEEGNFSDNFSAFRGFVDGPDSNAVVIVEDAPADRSADAGAWFVTTNEGSLLFDYSNGSLSESGFEGLFLFSDTDSSAVINLEDVAIDRNGTEGIHFDVGGGSQLLMSVQGGSVSDNGTTGNFTGVLGNVSGDGTTASVSFDGTTVDGNTEHGFAFDVTDGALFIAELLSTDEQGTLSASGNEGNGVRLTASGADTIAALVSSGPSQFNGNGAEGIFAEAIGVDQFVVGISGDVNGNDGDGVRINMDTVNLGAIQLEGGLVSTIDNNAGHGVNISLTDVVLDEIDVTGLTQEHTVGGLVINGLGINNNVGGGIVIDAENTFITPDTFRITNVLANGNQGGSGVEISLTDSAADGLTISNGGFEQNAGDGIALNLLRTPIDGLTIEDNDVGQGLDLAVNLLISGNVFSQPFSLFNNSSEGFDITRFQFDIDGTVGVWNTEDPGSPRPFQPLFNTDVTTGLASVNGVPVTPGTIPLEDSDGNILPGGGIPNLSTLIDLTFNDFNSEDVFFWNIDADRAGTPGTPIFGSDLIGSSVVVDFTGGFQLSGEMIPVPGNSTAAIFAASQTGPLGQGIVMNDGNGIVINADDSNLSNLSIQRNRVESNALSGIAINAENGTDVSGVIADNIVNGNGDNGIALNFNDSSLTDFTIERNTVDNNVGHGISLDFNNSPVTNLAIQDHPSINNNTQNGINMNMVDSDIDGLLIDNNGMGMITPGPGTGNYVIDLVFETPMTPSQQMTFLEAAARWEEIVIGDLPNVGAIDDILIFASIEPIDGPGGILGFAGPTGLRGDGTFLPFEGIMVFDSADVPGLETAGQFEAVILHEMAHVMGFGTIWDLQGLVDGSGTLDPRFIGPQATAEHNALFGVTEAGVPLENFLAGPGTAEAHWRQSVYDNELMTGFLNPGVPTPISRVTAAQWADLGYEIDITQADPFTPPLQGSTNQFDPGDVLLPEFAVVDGDNPLQNAAQFPSMVSRADAVRALQAIRMNDGHGINIELENSNLVNGMISGNVVANHENGDGIRVVNNTPQTNQVIQIDFENNQVGQSGGRGIHVDLNGLDQVNLGFTGNRVFDSGEEGINVNLENPAPVVPGTNTIVFNNNEIRNSEADGIAVRLRNQGLETFAAAGNTVANSGLNGFALDAEDSPITDILFNNNTFNGAAAGNGLLIELTNSGAESLAITNNQIGNSSETGMDIILDNSPIDSLMIVGNGVGLLDADSGPGPGDGTGLDDSLPVIRPGFNMNTLARNDDLSTGLVDIGFELDFLGQVFDQLYVNNNGNVTFTAPLATFTPFDLQSTNLPIIAPFFADVDTRNHGEPVTYGTGTVGGQAAFGVNFIDVDYFPSSTAHGDQLNTFQLILVDRSDIAPGDFDIEFNYEQITWETGGASGGTNGLGGNSARVGFSNGVDFNFELPGSAVNGAFLDDGPAATSLIQNSFNSEHDGRYVFFARGGGIGDGDGVASPVGGDGIRLTALNNSDIGELVINNNEVANASAHAIDLIISESTLPGPGGNFTINNNEIADVQTGDGIRMINPDTNGTPFEVEISGNSITNVGGNAINIGLNGDAGEMIATMTGNTVSESGQMGLRLDMRGTAQADVTLGETEATANTFSQNTNAGIGIDMRGDSVLALNVENTTVTGTTTDGSNANFNGEGFHLRMQGNSSLADLRIGDEDVMNTSFDGNASHGMAFHVNGAASLVDTEIRNVSSSNNNGDAINVRRFGAGTVDSFLVRNSLLNDNQGDGVDIQLRHSNFVDTYTLLENDISGNGGRGVSLLTEGDAQAVLNILFNTINNNGSDGIQTTQAANNPTDDRSFTGDWLGNQIAGNDGNGININGPYGQLNNVAIPLNIGASGVDAQGRSLGNEITGNDANGIRIGNTSGFANIVNNLIADNGNSGIQVNTPAPSHNLFIAENDILDNGAHGIDLISNVTTLGNRVTNAVIENNLIEGNARDGIQILSSAGDLSATSTITTGLSFMNVDITNGNEIAFNEGRGIDILVRGRAQANVFIDDVTVFRNTEEGIYSVVTADVTQGNEVPSTQALASNGGLFNRPVLTFNLSNSTVNANASPGGYDGGGVVFRVGTTGADLTGNNVNNTTWRQENTTSPGARGGLILSMEDNEMRNNFGVDLWMHTFVSTRNPNVTGGTWDDDEFNVQNYEQDPLARIRVDAFSGNTGGSVDLFGASNSVNSQQNFAWYNTNEPEFKSRRDNLDEQPGPFASATRRRNATRLPARTTFVTGNTLAPFVPVAGTNGTPGNSNQFLYPGVGESTLQVTSGADLNLNALFDDVISDFTSTIGIGGPGSGISGLDAMYYWQQF
jgi:trimeric autotransporter adhesin